MFDDDMIGVIHTILGFVALGCGVVVLLRPKGTRFHVILGRFYVVSMIGLNVTSFGIYNLFGTFGLFHWFALGSLATITGGMIPVLLRKRIKYWLHFHYHFMAWSYVGLLAATSNEAFVHVTVLHALAARIQWLPWIFAGLIGLAASIIIPTLAARIIKSNE